MEQLRERFLAAILSGDLPGALANAQEARSRAGIQTLYEELVTRSLSEVGRLWQTGRISVADEHVSSAIAQSVLAAQYPTFPWAPNGPRAIVTCVAGERHELGARVAADLIALDGWNVIYAGADVPIDALIDLAVRVSPVFVGLSVAMVERLPAVRETIARLQERLLGLKVLVGGRAVQLPHDLEIGAHATASSAASAIEVVRAWKP